MIRKGIANQFQALGLPSLFSVTGIGNIHDYEFERLCSRGSQKDERMFMSPQGLLPQKEPNCPRIIAGLAPPTGFMPPPIMNCPCPSPSCGICCTLGRVLIAAG